MGNMGYCRFQNTVNDLSDCVEALCNIGSRADLSSAERMAAQRMFDLCDEFRNYWEQTPEGEEEDDEDGED